MIFLDPRNTIGRLVEEHPRYMRVFDRFHIDYGFTGSLTLTEACLRHGLDLQELLGQLRETDRESAFLDHSVLEGFEPPELIEYILLTHHHFLEREMPRLEDLFQSVLKTAGDGHPEVLEWLTHFRRFRLTLERHMKKEGRELFPFCLSRGAGMDRDAWAQELEKRFKEMDEEDAEALEQLKGLRKSTDGYQVPEGAAPPFRYLLYDLQRLEAEVKRHLKVEAEILFPKVLANPPPASTSDWRIREDLH
jgi:regulator of cell morphogenesis and NO signaling